MNYWLDLFTPYTWTRFREHEASVSGFRTRHRKTAFERVKKGDLFLCYIVKLSRWGGVLEVAGDAFEDDKPIFADADDPYTIRFTVKPLVLLDFEMAIPIEEPELWQKLSFTRELAVGSVSWAQRARLRQTLVQLNDPDGRIITEALERQDRSRRVFPLDAADRRHIASRMVVRTEKGEVEVEVPDRQENGAENDSDAQGGAEFVKGAGQGGSAGGHSRVQRLGASW